MPLLFLERLEEKEMPTLQEVKNQMDKVRTQLEIFDRFDEEIKKTEKEVEAIKSKKAELQTFEDFKAVNSKEKYIADMKAQRTKLEKERIDSIVADARKINAKGYLETALEQDETVKRQRQEIKQKSVIKQIRAIKTLLNSLRNDKQISEVFSPLISDLLLAE